MKPAIKATDELSVPEFMQNRLQVDEKLMKYFKDKGLAWRWINMSKFRAERFHRTGWVPFKKQQDTPISAADQLLGESPDGFILRGDNVLAVKKASEAQAYKNFLRNRTAKITDAQQKEAAQAIKTAFKAAGQDVKVDEGFDESDE